MLRIAIGVLLVLSGIIGALYIAIWWGIIDPIMTIADAIDNDTVTAGLIGWEICKFFLKEIFAAIVFYVFVILGYRILISAK